MTPSTEMSIERARTILFTRLWNENQAFVTEARIIFDSTNGETYKLIREGGLDDQICHHLGIEI